MTFTPKLLSQVPVTPPDVQIFFHGQLLLRSEDGASCEVAVNSIATNHVLTIETRTKTPGRVDLVNMRHVGPLNFRESEGLLIEVKTPVGSPKAWKCLTLDSINYESGEAPPNNPPDEDFRWILNLEGVHFHEKDLDPPIFKSQNVIRLKGGEFFFQTAARTNRDFLFRRTDGGKSPKDFRRIGAIAKASVFLDRNQSIVLSWQDGTREQDRVLTLTKSDNCTYEIYIDNSPLFQETPIPADLPKCEELIEYYKVIPEIPPTVPTMPPQRFKLTPTPDDPLPGAGQAGSPSIPCQVLVLDGRTN